jgi:hypothetical protein
VGPAAQNSLPLIVHYQQALFVAAAAAAAAAAATTCADVDADLYP